MQIEVWADVVCPWCFIGKRRLQRALVDLDMVNDVEIIHRAFQLDPTASTRSEPTLDHLAAKYGLTREQALDMMSEVTEVAAAEGLAYRLDRTVTGNTRDAHRLLRWAQDRDPEAAQRLLETMYSAYFEQGRTVFTTDALVEMAGAAGLNPGVSRELLAGSEYGDEVEEDQEIARSLGATGVPFFVIDRRFGIAGAQPLEAFIGTLEQARTATG